MADNENVALVATDDAPPRPRPRAAGTPKHGDIDLDALEGPTVVVENVALVRRKIVTCPQGGRG